MIGPPGWNEEEKNEKVVYLAWRQPSNGHLYYLEFLTQGEAMAWGARWYEFCIKNARSLPPFDKYTIPNYVYTGPTAVRHYNKCLTLKDFGKISIRELDYAF